MSYLLLVFFIDCKVVKCSRVLLLNKCGVIFLLHQVRPHTLHKKKKKKQLHLVHLTRKHTQRHLSQQTFKCTSCHDKTLFLSSV